MNPLFSVVDINSIIDNSEDLHISTCDLCSSGLASDVIEMTVVTNDGPFGIEACLNHYHAINKNLGNC